MKGAAKMILGKVIHIYLVTVGANKRREYYQDYSHVMPDALETITDFLSKKEGGNDE